MPLTIELKQYIENLIRIKRNLTYSITVEKLEGAVLEVRSIWGSKIFYKVIGDVAKLEAASSIDDLRKAELDFDILPNQ
jgi:hypothetical protein